MHLRKDPRRLPRQPRRHPRLPRHLGHWKVHLYLERPEEEMKEEERILRRVYSMGVAVVSPSTALDDATGNVVA